jgi:hypothetical protein
MAANKGTYERVMNGKKWKFSFPHSKADLPRLACAHACRSHFGQPLHHNSCSIWPHAAVLQGHNKDNL